MKPIAILVAGAPLPATERARGGFAELIRQTSGSVWRGEWLDVDCRIVGDQAGFPDPAGVSGVIVTGSAASVTERAPWMERTAAYLRALLQSGTPTLGICFGHQLLGHALGGHVTRNPNGREIGSVELELLERDALFDRNQRPFIANMTHMDSVVDLPPGARVLARSALEPYAALRFSESAWGVQFHPEIDREVLGHYLVGRRPQLLDEGLDVEGLWRARDEGAFGNSVLRRFLGHASATRGGAPVDASRPLR